MGVSLVAIWLVYAFLTRWCPHLLYLADLAGDGEGEEKCFTFTLYLGSHTHIFKTRIFNQNSTLKSIKSLDGLEREKTLIDSCGLWGIPVATVYRCIWKWWPTESSLVLGSMGLFLFGFAKSIYLWLLPPRIDFGIQPQWTALGSLCQVLMWVFPQSLVLPGVVSLGTDGEGWGRKFTFVLYLGSHTHIFKTKFFNQNSTFKFIELLDRPEKEKILTKSRELWGIPVAPVCCCIWKWRSSDSPPVLG